MIINLYGVLVILISTVHEELYYSYQYIYVTLNPVGLYAQVSACQLC